MTNIKRKTSHQIWCLNSTLGMLEPFHYVYPRY